MLPRPYWKPGFDGPVKFSRDGTLLADREAKNVVSVRDVATLREVTSIRAAEPPSLLVPEPSILGPALPAGDAWKWGFAHFFDTEGKILTVSGRVVQRWEPRTGQELAKFNVGPLLPDGKPDVMIAPGPAPNEVAVIVLGNPVVRIVDITTGKIT
ncbi:hypothetical protein ACWCXX_34545 [Streptomyces sp. NPDC001732]